MAQTQPVAARALEVDVSVFFIATRPIHSDCRAFFYQENPADADSAFGAS
jgi:hypothetical protein